MTEISCRWCKHCGTNVYPPDAHIRLLSAGFSLALGRVIRRMSADKAYGRVVDDLLEDYDVRLCKQTIENVAEATGC